MTTLFMPMAPNPVMGGFVLHVENDHVYDIDISVEEGIQSIVSSGVTVGADSEVTGDIGEIEPVETPAQLVEQSEVPASESVESAADEPSPASE